MLLRLKVFTTDVVEERVEFIEWKDAKPRNEKTKAAFNGDDIPDSFEQIDADVPF